MTTHALAAEPADDPHWKITQGRIQQSVVHWCFKPMPVEQLAQNAADLGLKSVELVAPADWPILKKHGLTCAIASSHGFVKGWNQKENWDYCTEKITAAVTAAAAFGCQLFGRTF
jgi:hydroxypyruvate isomerase